LVVGLWRDDSGQDLIEYGLLSAIVAVAGAAVLPAIATRMGQLFQQWGSNINNASVPNNPL
jgi:Flp pilus assembly pilin Flp